MRVRASSDVRTRLWRAVCTVAAVGLALSAAVGRAQAPAAGVLATSVVYEVFVRTFGPNGTLADVQARLPHLRDLGADILWLMPIHPVGAAGRKGAAGSPYAVRDFFAIDPAAGTADDLKRLIGAAHAQGMRVLLDMVPNHCAPDNPLVQEHPDWVVRDRLGQPVPPVREWTDVVQLNYEHAGLRAQMQSLMDFWLATFSVDGYRVDTASMVPLTFWRTALAVLRAKYPHAVLIAEGQDAALHEAGFDVTYDDTLYHLLLGVVRRQRPARAVTEHLEESARRAPNHIRLRYIENHDRDRAASAFPPPCDRVAAALIFTAPGLPLVHAGQEVGLTQRTDLFDRSPLPWDHGRAEVLAFYRQLIRLRKETAVLTSGSFIPVLNNVPADVVSFVRGSPERDILVVLNFSKRALPRLDLRGVPEQARMLALHDLLSGERILFRMGWRAESFDVALAPYGVVIAEILREQPEPTVP